MAIKYRCTTESGAVLIISAASEDEARELVGRRGQVLVGLEVTGTPSATPGSMAVPTADSAGGSEVPVHAPGDRYANLRGLGTGMINFAKILQGAGKVIAVLCVAAACVPNLKEEGRIVLIILSLVAGLGFHAAGMCVAAMGEALHALADIATHTGRIPLREAAGAESSSG